MDSTPTVYLAGPQVFTPYGREFIPNDIIPLLENLSYDPVFPAELGDETVLQELSEEPLSAERAQAYRNWSEETGQRNMDAIDTADLVLANLDGADVDSGTAAEITYAASQNTPVIGYRTDTRHSGENDGVIVNLQVEQFIKESGGTIISPPHLRAGHCHR